jgi:hypothetical protein
VARPDPCAPRTVLAGPDPCQHSDRQDTPRKSHGVERVKRNRHFLRVGRVSDESLDASGEARCDQAATLSQLDPEVADALLAVVREERVVALPASEIAA